MRLLSLRRHLGFYFPQLLFPLPISNSFALNFTKVPGSEAHWKCKAKHNKTNGTPHPQPEKLVLDRAEVRKLSAKGRIVYILGAATWLCCCSRHRGVTSLRCNVLHKGRSRGGLASVQRTSRRGNLCAVLPQIKELGSEGQVGTESAFGLLCGRPRVIRMEQTALSHSEGVMSRCFDHRLLRPVRGALQSQPAVGGRLRMTMGDSPAQGARGSRRSACSCLPLQMVALQPHKCRSKCNSSLTCLCWGMARRCLR